MTDVNQQPSSMQRDEPSPPGKPQSRERQDRITILLCFVFLACLWGGYQIGKDMAERDNRADCVAAGGSDCG